MKKNLFLLLVACQLFAGGYLKAQTVENINGTDVIVKPADSMGVKQAYAAHLNRLRLSRANIRAVQVRIANTRVSAHADSLSKNAPKIHNDNNINKRLQNVLFTAQSQLASDRADSATWAEEIKTLRNK